MSRKRSTAAAFLAILALAGCKRVGEVPADPHGGGGAYPSEGEHASAGHEEVGTDGAEGPHGVVPAAPRTPLLFVASGLVPDRVGPGGKPFEVAQRTSERVGHQRTIGRSTFSIAMRSDNLTYYPCSSCHAGGSAVAPSSRASDVHQDIQPVHPSENNAVCTACHVSDDPSWLTLVGAEPVPLNEAYRLCAQCHFRQVQAWAGGAHGKRLDTWLGPRVVMGCTDCHDPHDPGIPTRIPFPGPRVPRTGPRQP